MKPAVAPGSSTRLGSGPAHAGRDGRTEELSPWRRAPTEGVGADGATFGDDPVVQTVALIFLLSPGLRHLQTAKRDGGVWGVREGGRAVWEAFFWVCSSVPRRHARLRQHAGVRSGPWSLGGQTGGRCQKKKTVRRQNGAFRIFARTLRTRATPNDERKQGIRSSRGNATRLERASRWVDLIKGVKTEVQEPGFLNYLSK